MNNNSVKASHSLIEKNKMYSALMEETFELFDEFFEIYQRLSQKFKILRKKKDQLLNVDIETIAEFSDSENSQNLSSTSKFVKIS